MYRALLIIAALGGCGVEGESPEAVEAPAFSVAILPDTQGYTQFAPEVFEEQTSWLAANREELSIEMVVHVGDLVEGSWLTEQWETAKTAMGYLDGVIPYAIAPGNHDLGASYDGRNARDQSTLLDSYFPQALFESMPTFGEFFPDGARVDNSFQLFEAGGDEWLVLALEFGPRDEVLAWADQVLGDYAHRKAIVVTHAYLYSDSLRYNWQEYGELQQWNPHSYGYDTADNSVNDAEEMWAKVLSKHPNVLAVLSGHTLNSGLGYQVSNGAGTVHEILANYQMRQDLGGGYLRLMTFDPGTRTVSVRTYSPWRRDFQEDPLNQFEFPY